MKILFKYATRSRPELFKRGIESIINNVESSDYHILVSVDADDIRWPECKRFINDDSHTTLIVGESKNKIDAINRDVNELDYDWDILVVMSDDMVFIEKGFDNVIRNSFWYPVNAEETHGIVIMDKCLHFPDGNRNDLITMSIMGRDYYNRFGYIYHPDYISLYCDNEQTEVSKMLGCYKYVDKQIFEHRHPAYGKAVFDAQYQHTESFNEVDRQTYLRRKEMNFGL